MRLSKSVGSICHSERAIEHMPYNIDSIGNINRKIEDTTIKEKIVSTENVGNTETNIGMRKIARDTCTTCGNLNKPEIVIAQQNNKINDGCKMEVDCTNVIKKKDPLDTATKNIEDNFNEVGGKNDNKEDANKQPQEPESPPIVEEKKNCNCDQDEKQVKEPSLIEKRPPEEMPLGAYLKEENVTTFPTSPGHLVVAVKVKQTITVTVTMTEFEIKTIFHHNNCSQNYGPTSHDLKDPVVGVFVLFKLLNKMAKYHVLENPVWKLLFNAISHASASR